MAVAVCPACGETIKLAGQPKIGERITCRYCEEHLEIVDINPIELDWAYYDEEEWLDEEAGDDYEDEEGY